MELGVYTFATERDMSPANLAVAVEERGFSRLMFAEHSHIPVARQVAYPDVYGGGVLPDFYKRTYDPFVACSFAAAATTRLKIGTGVCLVALRDPIHTAKEVASVDRLSGGRFVFGVGFGWNADEFVNHGVSFRGRHALVKEKVALMRELWTQEVAHFCGEALRLEPSWAWPKPLQAPHPPILLGGNGPLTMRHAAEWADAWYPTAPADDPILDRSIEPFRALVEHFGRAASQVAVGAAPATVDARTLERYRANGVDFVDVAAIADSPGALLRQLDALAALREAVLGSPEAGTPVRRAVAESR